MQRILCLLLAGGLFGLAGWFAWSSNAPLESSGPDAPAPVVKSDHDNAPVPNRGEPVESPQSPWSDSSGQNTLGLSPGQYQLRLTVFQVAPQAHAGYDLPMRLHLSEHCFAPLGWNAPLILALSSDLRSASLDPL